MEISIENGDAARCSRAWLHDTEEWKNTVLEGVLACWESPVERNEDTEADVRAGKEVKAEYRLLKTLWKEIN